MKKIFIVFLMIMTMLFASRASALTIGDIDFNLVPAGTPLAVGIENDYMLRTHAYPDASILVIQVLCTQNPFGGYNITTVRYLKDGVLHVWEYAQGENPDGKYELILNLKPDEIKRITDEITGFIANLDL